MSIAASSRTDRVEATMKCPAQKSVGSFSDLTNLVSLYIRDLVVVGLTGTKGCLLG